MSDAAAYRPPDLASPALEQAPPARTVRVTRDGVLPDGFFATTNLPTYVKGADGRWTMPREPRMDGVLVRDADGGWWVREGRRVRAGDEVVVGSAEDGREGVLVHATGFHKAFRSNEGEVARINEVGQLAITRNPQGVVAL